MPYSASTMFVTHAIPSFFELLGTSIKFADRVSKNSNSINMACMTPIVYNYSIFHSVLMEIGIILICIISLCFIIFYYYYYY